MAHTAPNRLHVEFLMKVVTSLADGFKSLADRREAFLLALAEEVSADAGHWAWGKGMPEEQGLVVVAHIPFGFTPEQLVSLLEFGMSVELNESFQLPQLKFRRDDGMICVLRSDIVPDDAVSESTLRLAFVRCGHEEWMNAVRYGADDTWSQFFFLRKIGRPHFDRQDLELIDLALSTIPWLWSTAEETLPPEKAIGLTPRQRIVTLHLLSGLSRKMIAKQLHISELTVNDHVKAVFEHFQVSSVTELAAIFLRSK